MERRIRKRRAAAGMTLLEVMLVLVILVVLGSMAAVAIMGQQGKAEKNAARAQIQTFTRAIELYRFDMKKFPESLEALRETPSDDAMRERWGGPYLNKKVPDDPWGSDYRYEADGDSFRVWSVGPDLSDGGDDDIASDDE